MAHQVYEPFLINPPRRLRKRYRRNDADMGGEAAAPWEMGLGVKPGHKTTAMSKAHRKYRKRALKAHKTRRKNLRLKESTMAKVSTKRRRHHKATPAQLRSLKKARAARKRNLRGTSTKKRRTVKRRAVKRHVVKHRAVKRHVVKRRKVARKTKRTSTYKRGWAKRHKRHVIAAYKRRGHLFTSPFAKTVRRNLRLNPFRRNPFGEELMVVGANPRKRRYTMARVKHHRRRRHHTKRMRHNPLISTSMIKMIAGGIGGAIAAKNFPRLVSGFIGNSAIATYGAAAAAVVGGSYAIDKFAKSKDISEGWMIGGAAAILSEILVGFTGGMLQGLGLIGNDLEYSAFPEYGAFPQYQGLGDYGMTDEFAPTAVV